jgi:hypothetical protein
MLHKIPEIEKAVEIIEHIKKPKGKNINFKEFFFYNNN